MYRTDPIPYLQDKRNAIFNRRLGFLLVFCILVLVGSPALLLGLYFRGDRQPAEHVARIIGPDGSTVIGPAVLVSLQSVLTAVAVPDGSQVSLQETDRLPASKVRKDNVTPGTELTLLKLTAPSTDTPNVSAAASGMKVYAVSLHDRWEGTLVQTAGQTWFEPQPAATIGPGAPVYSVEDRSLIGITAQTSSGLVVISMKEILQKFREIQSGQ